MRISGPTELLWALIGLILTIVGTFVGASMVWASGANSSDSAWVLGQLGVQVYSLNVTCQIGAVLLVGCMGGRNAATLAQIAYLILGLVGVPVFTHGGGITYLQEPTFGYLLGFVPGAWVCGWLAFQATAKIESLAFSSLMGLLVIHLSGLIYLTVGYIFSWLNTDLPFLEAVFTFTIFALPQQLAIVCAVTLTAFAGRRVLFY